MSAPPPDPRAAADELRTVRDLLRWGVSRFREAGLSYGHGTTTALDDAAFMVLETLGLPIDELDPWLDARLTRAERLQVAEALARRAATRMPAPYVVGRAYIQGVPFRSDPRAIVPRSYIGELLASDLFGGEGFALVEDPGAVRRVLDLCTGSGCLAVLAAMRFPHAAVDAVDLSHDALSLAAENLGDHGMEERVELLEGDLFAPVWGRRYDLILSNPPYVADEEMAVLPAEHRHEPELALAGGRDGLDVVRRILHDAAAHLAPDGGIVCEIGTGREALEAEFPDLPFLWLETADSFGEVFWLTREQIEGGRGGRS